MQGRGSQPELMESDEFGEDLLREVLEDNPVEAGIKSDLVGTKTCWREQFC